MTDSATITLHAPGDAAGGLYVIGVGASAGGLEAIETFLDNVPAGSGAAFVVVQHLSPDFKSLMPELLARHTPMPIHRAEDGMRVLADNLYLIPPRMDMRIKNGCLRLSEQDASRQPPLPIDIFLESLAEDAGEGAIGIILSGTGSDGSRGVAAIRKKGGLVLAQDVASAKFDGMPAAAAGSADLVLSPEEMGERLLAYMTSPERFREDEVETQPTLSGEPLEDIFVLLKRAHGIDFSRYKERTIGRRLQRRLGILQMHDLDTYRDHLLDTPSELDKLHQSLLIGVTEFFRDADAFECLEQDIPRLWDLAGEENLRIWIAGCATGEEAYSVALLLEESRERTGRPVDYRIFATDVNARNVSAASEGVYSAADVDSLDRGRLGRYFERHGEGYRILRTIRDKVVFARHNLMEDPPFTRMHLVSCRNLLIYMQPEIQSRILRYLHFALVPKGSLLLGPSETTGDLADEFEVIAGKWRLFRKRRNIKLAPTEAILGVATRGMATALRAASSPITGYLDFDRVCSAFLSEFVPTSFLLNEQGHVLHTFGDPSAYVTMAPGRASLELLRMLGPEARTAVSTAMHRSQRTGKAIHYSDVRFAVGEKVTLSDVTVRYMPPQPGTDQAPLHLVLIGTPRPPVESETTPAETLQTASAGRAVQLEEELQHTKENLQATIEELETTNEELQSTNEELVASNEELQSTNEELHSVNEELYTVNAEHQRKIEELSELTQDMENLLQGTEIGTVFLDANLRIRKFTDHAADVVALMASDMDRPIEHLAHGLQDTDLGHLARQVVERGVRIEQEATDRNGVPRLLRLLPYLVDGVADGVVITFMDISRVREAQASLQESEQRFQQLIENLDMIFWIASPDGGSIQYVSPLFEEIWGLRAEELYANPDVWLERIHPEDREHVARAYRNELETGGYDVEYRIQREDGMDRWIHAKGFPVRDADGRVRRVAGFARDITGQRMQQTQLERLARELENQARTDALTGLYNRRGLERGMGLELNRAQRGGQKIAAVLVDLDDFKQVNDQLGHATGDVVLQDLATRMTMALRPSDSLARVGGDEFLALLPDTRLAEATQVAERLRLAIKDSPIEVAGKPLEVSASLGVCVIPLDTVSVEEVLDGTRHALATGKAQGKDRVVAATDGEGRAFTAETGGGDLEALFEEGAIEAWSQPIRDLPTGEVVAYELLSRGPEGAYREPRDIFRLSQEHSVLVRMDLHCLRACVAGAAALKTDLPLHVNLFPSTLVDTPIERVVELLGEAGGAHRFCVELSEQQFLGAPSYLAEATELLKQAGASLALDDVGFGRSSLEALVVLEPHMIKISREFVHGADEDPVRRRGLSRLINAARALSAQVVAEGVESEAERSVLEDLGVMLGQGFLWDRPKRV